MIFETTALQCGYKNGSANALVVKTEPIKIQQSELLFLIGRNGSGKSTLLQTLAGVLPSLDGEILFHGSSILEGASIEQRPAFLPANLNIHIDLLGSDLGQLYEIHRSRWYQAAILEALEVDDLLERRIGSLSSGERQRLLLAMTLAHPSDLVFIDEPSSHMDIHYLFQLTRVLQRQCHNGRSIMISTHDFNWILQSPNSKATLIHDRQLEVFQPPIQLLDSEIFQSSFVLKTQIIENPLDQTKAFVCTSKEE